MKKKISISFIVIILITSMIVKNKNTNLKKIRNLTLENIEALASNEGDDGFFRCYGRGSVDCNGMKVELMYEREKQILFFD